MNASGLSKSGRCLAFWMSSLGILALVGTSPLGAGIHRGPIRVGQTAQKQVRTPRVKPKQVRDDRPKVKTSDKKKSAKDADVQEPRQYFDGH